jgi:undecaprenyl diphosphate synthase
MRTPLDPKLEALVAKASLWPVIKPPVGREALPAHVAIIMDGNGRWATRQGMVRINGHQMGVDSVRSVTRYCGQVGVKALTLYAFSTENWKRPKAEINFLFRLLKKYLVNERPELIANGVRLTSIGHTEALPEAVREELDRTQQFTAGNTGLNLCLALNYGAHGEILDATQAVLSCVAAGELQPEEITQDTLDAALFTAGMPGIDLLIRTAGERRLSNFLLWQSSGAQFHVTPTCWPDFREVDLKEAIVQFSKARAKQAS